MKFVIIIIVNLDSRIKVKVYIQAKWLIRPKLVLVSVGVWKTRSTAAPLWITFYRITLLVQSLIHRGEEKQIFGAKFLVQVNNVTTRLEYRPSLGYHTSLPKPYNWQTFLLTLTQWRAYPLQCVKDLSLHRQISPSPKKYVQLTKGFFYIPQLEKIDLKIQLWWGRCKHHLKRHFA